mmetsp:Transcript_20063/g.59924  ORF Transcript_20063/g.59924 Transcript_20063/m.59924 type:complete len:289 (-) Transcript_20063:50-916(-)
MVVVALDRLVRTFDAADPVLEFQIFRDVDHEAIVSIQRVPELVHRLDVDRIAAVPAERDARLLPAREAHDAVRVVVLVDLAAFKDRVLVHQHGVVVVEPVQGEEVFFVGAVVARARADDLVRAVSAERVFRAVLLRLQLIAAGAIASGRLPFVVPEVALDGDGACWHLPCLLEQARRVLGVLEIFGRRGRVRPPGFVGGRHSASARRRLVIPAATVARVDGAEAVDGFRLASALGRRRDPCAGHVVAAGAAPGLEIAAPRPGVVEGRLVALHCGCCAFEEHSYRREGL